MHSSHHCSPFYVVYGFNPLTPLDLIVLPNRELVNSNASKRANQVKKLHEEVKLALEKKAESNAKAMNKNRKPMLFEVGDWVWLHFRKERFPELRKSKLQPRGDGPFQIVQKINNNAYKLDLPGEYGVHATFNVNDLTPFDVGDTYADLRANPSQGGGDDEDIQEDTTYRGGGALDALHFPSGPVTRSRLQQFQNALITYIQDEFGQAPFMATKEGPSSINLISWKPNVPMEEP